MRFRLLHLLKSDPARLLVGAEALLTLAWASAIIQVLPFRIVAGIACHSARSPQRHCQPGDSSVRICCWAMEAWSKRVPWKAVCFQKGLALQLMLRRRGVRAKLHYGVAQTAAEGLRAHVWISVGSTVVLGGETASEFTCLATFPAGQTNT